MRITISLLLLQIYLLVGCSSGVTPPKIKDTLSVSKQIDTTVFSQYYPEGIAIAEGLCLSIVTGFQIVDPNLKYNLTTKRDVFSYENIDWPIVDVTINVVSKSLNNPKITFTIFMEEDPKTEQIVGTVKSVRVDGKKDKSLSKMENTMYIEDEEGTRMVALKNGELILID